MDSGEDDMAAIMGFSTFSDMPKPKRQKLNKNDQNATNANNTPLGQRQQRETHIESLVEGVAISEGHAGSATSSAISLPVGRTAASGAGSNHYSEGPVQQVDPLEVLSKPVGDLTPRDLQMLRSGIKQADGRTVFFSPRFIEEDPWSRLRNQ